MSKSNDFAERVRAGRLALGMSQEDLSKRMNLSRSAISMWERGLRSPDYETVTDLAILFEVTPQYLLGWTDNPAFEAPVWKVSDEDRELFDKMLPKLISYDGNDEPSPKLAILFSRSRKLTDKQLDIINSIVQEMTDEQDGVN